MGSTIGKPVKANNYWHNRQTSPCQYPHSNLHYPGIGKDGSISQGVADGNETVIGHGKQHTRLHDRKSMDKVGLREAGPMANLSVIQPQDSQNCGHCGHCHSEICSCQHS